MAWLYLFLAGLFEIGWPVGLRISQNPDNRVLGISLAIIFMAVSGFLLWLAQKDIPLGVSYAVWTGIGTIGTFFVGVFFFSEAAALAKYLGVFFIVGGIVLLKLG